MVIVTLQLRTDWLMVAIEQRENGDKRVQRPQSRPT